MSISADEFLNEFRKALRGLPSKITLTPMPDEEIEAIKDIRKMTRGCVPMVSGISNMVELKQFLLDHPNFVEMLKAKQAI